MILRHHTRFVARAVSRSTRKGSLATGRAVARKGRRCSGLNGGGEKVCDVLSSASQTSFLKQCYFAASRTVTSLGPYATVRFPQTFFSGDTEENGSLPTLVLPIFKLVKALTVLPNQKKVWVVLGNRSLEPPMSLVGSRKTVDGFGKN